MARKKIAQVWKWGQVIVRLGHITSHRHSTRHRGCCPLISKACVEVPFFLSFRFHTVYRIAQKFLAIHDWRKRRSLIFLTYERKRSQPDCPKNKPRICVKLVDENNDDSASHGITTRASARKLRVSYTPMLESSLGNAISHSFSSVYITFLNENRFTSRKERKNEYCCGAVPSDRGLRFEADP